MKKIAPSCRADEESDGFCGQKDGNCFLCGTARRSEASVFWVVDSEGDRWMKVGGGEGWGEGRDKVVWWGAVAPTN